jgi:hypothetical protein
MQLKTICLTLIIIGCSPSFISAQGSNEVSLQRSTVSAFGGSNTTNNIYISHTAGQSSGYTQNSAGSLDLRQGFEQALIFSNGSDQQTVRMVVYPNPNSGTFYVATDLPRGMNYTLVIQDIQGKRLFSGEGEGGTESRFDLPEGITPGTYPALLQTSDGLKAETKIIIL